MEFNTVVDINQQPLKQVSIDWGDGSRQILANIDNKPDKEDPHKFYHYYYKGTWSVSVHIIDNWDKFSDFNKP